MTGKTNRRKQAVQIARRYADRDLTPVEMWMHGRRAGVRAERKRFKEERARWLRMIASLEKQLEPFRGAHNSPLTPEQVARREMYRAEQNFQQENRR